MDDALIVGGAITISAGVALVFPPAGLIALGVFAVVGGVAKARRGK